RARRRGAPPAARREGPAARRAVRRRQPDRTRGPRVGPRGLRAQLGALRVADPRRALGRQPARRARPRELLWAAPRTGRDGRSANALETRFLDRASRPLSSPA